MIYTSVTGLEVVVAVKEVLVEQAKQFCSGTIIKIVSVLYNIPTLVE